MVFPLYVHIGSSGFFCQCFVILIIGLVISLLKFISRHFGLVGWFAADLESPGLIDLAASAS